MPHGTRSSASHDPITRGINLRRWRASPHCLVRFLLGAAVAVSTVAPASAQTRAQTGGAPDSGVFEILAAQRRVGTERFQIRQSGAGWEATGQLQLEAPGGAKVEETSTLRLNATLRPTAYERAQKSPLSAKLQAQIGTSETMLVSTAGEEPVEQVFYLPENDLVVLDTNFFHHFSVLLRMYDQAKGGVQPFNVFIPQEALPGTINLQYLGKENVTVGRATKELEHYQAATDEHEIEIWATPEAAIHRISIPGASLEVLRQ